jgi:hypothetical protein
MDPNSIQIKNVIEKGPKEILRIADAMWAAFKKGGFGPDGNASEELVLRIQQENREFCTSYPVVLRYMAAGEYRHRAMEKFLDYVARCPWTSTEKYLDTQTHYIVLLYKELHPRYDNEKIKNLRANIRAMLEHEHNEATELIKSKVAEVEAEEQALREKSLEELKQFYAKYREETVHVPLRIALEDDIPAAAGNTTTVPTDTSAVAVSAASLLD